MSEPFVKPRAASGTEDPRSPERDDPLAELARLVGRDDPFRGMFPAKSGRPDARLLPPAPLPHPVIDPRHYIQPAPSHDYNPQHEDDVAEGHDDHPGYEPDGYVEHPEYEHHPDLDAQLRGSLNGQGEGYGSAQAPRDSLRFPPISRGDVPFADPRSAHSDEDMAVDAPPLNADLWAEGAVDPHPGPEVNLHAENDAAPMADDRSPRRTLVVLVAVLALTAGGLGATFLVRGGGMASNASTSDAPTIMAATGPSKIQPPDNATDAGASEGSPALLEKSGSDNVSNAKVVNAQEQPVDLAQLPKAGSAGDADDGHPAAAASGNGLPEPRKVKTILIRPDGSVVGDNTNAAQTATPPPVVGVVMPSMLTAQSPQPPDPVPEPVAKAATPKNTARASTTPKATVSADGTPASKPRQSSSPTRSAAKAKPIEVADATAGPVETTASTSGGYAVQLAAPPSEQDAKTTSARLQKKFAEELAGRTPSIRKADNGDKSVYRVRVGNLSQDDAKSLCSKLQAGGGSCFVVRN